jgi:hypothetical protein
VGSDRPCRSRDIASTFFQPGRGHAATARWEPSSARQIDIPNRDREHESYRTAESVTNGDRLKRIASYLLTCGQDEVSARDLTRHVASLRGLSLFDLNKQMSPLVAAGWLEPEDLSPINRTWYVNDAVAEQFAEQKEREESRKQKLAKLMGSPRKSQSAGE